MNDTALNSLLMDAEPTQAAPSEDVTQSIYAWSETSDDETLAFQPRSWKLPVVLAVLAVAAVIAGVVAVWPHHSTPEVPAAQAVPRTVPTIEPAPALPPTPPPVEELNPDARFVANLKAQGWTFSVPDSEVAQEGHGVCRDMAGGKGFEQEVNGVAAGSGIEPSHARRFILTAADMFCPQYSPR